MSEIIRIFAQIKNMTVQNSYVEFHNGTELLGKFDVEAFEEIEEIIKENDIVDWDYFEFHMDATAEESKGDGRYYKHHQTVQITETYEGYQEFLEEVRKVREQIEEAMGDEAMLDLSDIANLEPTNGHSEEETGETDDEDYEPRDDAQELGD